MYQKLYEELILSKDVNIKMKQGTCEIIQLYMMNLVDVF